jgi:23S rRNA pseudouridine1911/1915/1917 synthase
VGLIHRLDRDAAGLLVFSKNNAAYESLKSQFFHHTVERVYFSVVTGVPKPPGGRIHSRLMERADGTVYSTKAHAKGQPAITDYQTVQTANGHSLLRISLHTGRKHQIRVHLFERGWPIVGDRVYGADAAGDSVLLLQATELSFTHPRTQQRLHFEIPLPPAFTQFFR